MPNWVCGNLGQSVMGEARNGAPSSKVFRRTLTLKLLTERLKLLQDVGRVLLQLAVYCRVAFAYGAIDQVRHTGYEGGKRATPPYKSSRITRDSQSSKDEAMRFTSPESCMYNHTLCPSKGWEIFQQPVRTHASKFKNRDIIFFERFHFCPQNWDSLRKLCITPREIC